MSDDDDLAAQAHDRYFGKRITYVDTNATTMGDEPVLVTGPCNGPPIAHNGVLYVPVWSACDNGRESTTVYVVESNIMEVA